LTSPSPHSPNEKFYAWTAALSLAVILVCYLGLDVTFEKDSTATNRQTNRGIPIEFVDFAPLSETRKGSISARPSDPVLAGKTQPSQPQAVSAVQEKSGGSPTLVPAKFTPEVGGAFPEPLYPRWAKQQGVQGRLVLRVAVHSGGGVGIIRIESSSGNARLDQFAIDWVRERWSWPAGAERMFLVPFLFELQ
jgi:protein TonB